MNDSDSIAISNFMNFLSRHDQDSFFAWLDNRTSEIGASYRLAGTPLNIRQYNKRQLFSLNKYRDKLLNHLLKQRQRGNLNQHYLIDKDLVIFHDITSDHSNGFIIVITQVILQSFLSLKFPNVKITPALQRLLTALICGIPLTDLARIDNKSINTIKRQAQELRNRFGVDHSDDAMRIVMSELTRAISEMLNKDSSVDTEYFQDYVAKYLPKSVRAPIFVGNNQHKLPGYKVLDLGPKNGKPIIVLHGLTLPDIRECDARLLDTLGLRLLLPLRNGLLGPEDPTLSEETQITAAMEQIDLVSNIFCESPITILCCASSSKIAMRYISKDTKAVDAIYFVSACVVDGRPKTAANRFAKGLLAIARNNKPLLNSSLEYFRNKAMATKRFPKFMRYHFADSVADTQIIEQEFASDNNGERLREALVNSIASIRHDFGFQRALGWDQAAKLDLPMTFIHGEDDAIHPPDLIEKLVDRMINAKLVVIPNAGQLLYYEHFQTIVRYIAKDLDTNE